MTNGNRGPAQVGSALPPSGGGRGKLDASLSGTNGSAGSQGAGSLGLNLGSNALFIWAGAAVLLVAAAVSVGLLGSSGTPNLSSQTQTQHAVIGASLMQPVAADESEQAIARLMMSGPEKERVRAELAGGKLRLALITVSDSDEEDGDWVRVAAAGFQQDVRLFHKPYTVAVPYIPGMPVSVIGLVDGGGGDITVAVYVGSARLSLRPLKTGEVLQIPAP